MLPGDKAAARQASVEIRLVRFALAVILDEPFPQFRFSQHYFPFFGLRGLLEYGPVCPILSPFLTWS
jgi:hypothetical protein